MDVTNFKIFKIKPAISTLLKLCTFGETCVLFVTRVQQRSLNNFRIFPLSGRRLCLQQTIPKRPRKAEGQILDLLSFMHLGSEQ